VLSSKVCDKCPGGMADCPLCEKFAGEVTSEFATFEYRLHTIQEGRLLIAGVADDDPDMRAELLSRAHQKLGC
jgi:hypothetical protein